MRVGIAAFALCAMWVSFAQALPDAAPIRIAAQVAGRPFEGVIEVTVVNGSNRQLLIDVSHGAGWSTAATLYGIDGANKRVVVYSRRFISGSGGFVVIKPGKTGTLRLRVPGDVLRAGFKSYVLSLAVGGAEVYSGPFEIHAATGK